MQEPESPPELNPHGTRCLAQWIHPAPQPQVDLWCVLHYPFAGLFSYALNRTLPPVNQECRYWQSRCWRQPTEPGIRTRCTVLSTLYTSNQETSIPNPASPGPDLPLVGFIRAVGNIQDCCACYTIPQTLCSEYGGLLGKEQLR